MDRRTTIATLFGRPPAPTPQPLVNSGLEPYTGPWAFEQAAHLLRRTTFGPGNEQIKSSVELGLEATLDLLFLDTPLPDPPINYYFQNDPFVPVGSTWIDAPYSQDVNLIPHRARSLRAWTLGLIFEEGISLREKLTLFWHNHFAINNINDPKYLYRYISLFRSQAWGNFRELVKAVTIDPTMLRFLNGNQNSAAAPNENYARELLELFTIGKGDLAGPGDYTTFTEDDVVQMARVLTGWRDQGFRTFNPDLEIGAVFRPTRHDTGSKQLSHRFGEVVINNMGDQEYAHLIDIIFQQEEVARFICRKLYRWFIYYNIDDNAEVNVIEPMAQLLIANDFEIRPALRALLNSTHFFDMLNVGPMIKNPLDFLASSVKPTLVAFPVPLNQRYALWARIFGITENMQMVYFDPPDVAGWKAYYQEPLYYRTWINAATLPVRMEITDRLATSGYVLGDFPFRIDVLAFIAGLDNPLDPNLLIEEINRLLLPQPLTQEQIDALKEILLPGLPDYEWTVEYGQYLADPDNSDLAEAIEAKLRNLMQVILSLPEFYLS